jgi:hypothetical protein
MAYGGRLFNPERFPVLEHPDCRVSNRTLYKVLHLLLFARQKRNGEPQRVGYLSIDGDAILDEIGEAYHEHRRQLMLENNEGLTKAYNRFHNPACTDGGIQKLRDLHVQMDYAVRDAYGWHDLSLEHAWQETVTTEEQKDKRTGKVRTLEKAEHRFTISERAKQELLRHLLELNHQIHDAEVASGLHQTQKSGRGKKAPKKKARGPVKRVRTTPKPEPLALFPEKDPVKSSPKDGASKARPPSKSKSSKARGKGVKEKTT